MLASRLRLVAINDVYELTNLPKLQTFLSKLSPVPNAVLLAGDFLSPSTLSAIDGGRGMIATLRATGVTHFCVGNHEADLQLPTLQERITELSKSATFINSNMRNPPPSASWLTSSMAHPYAIIRSPDDRVKVALLGFMSDEEGVFRDKTFKGVPISNVLDTFSALYREVIPSLADLVLPMTHQSLVRDRQLAQLMLSTHGGNGIIVGGHEDSPINEDVKNESNDTVSIIKSGSDAHHASLIDLYFDISVQPPILQRVETTLVNLAQYEDSKIVKSIADSHLAVVQKMENEILVEGDSLMPPGKVLSSERTRFEQTTIGSFFCQAIKEELGVDVALINGGTIKGNTSYDGNRMSYAQLKKELPFPTKMVVVEMKRSDLQHAIHFSRNRMEEGAVPNALGEIPRRGYLQVDLDFDLDPHTGDHDDVLKVALPRNLMAGFCKIKPLTDLGNELAVQERFPGPDDFVPALDLVMRHCCKNRWFDIVHEQYSFQDLDLNRDGVIDRHEVKIMMEKFLGHEPADFVVDSMIASIDKDGNGVIDVGELSYIIATMEREQQWRKF